jgi:hypothetical protein
LPTVTSDGNATGVMQRTDRIRQDCLHLFVLWSFAFAQPVYDRLAANHTFLTALRIQRISTLFAVFLISLGVPTLLVCVELAVRIWFPGLRRWLHGLFVALLLTLIALPLLGRMRFLPGMLHIILSLAIGAIGSFSAYRCKWIRAIFTAACPAIIAFPAWMLFFSPVSRGMLQGRVQPMPPADQPIHLALAINDTIRAVTRTYQMPGIADAWSAIVPELSFRLGENTIRVFEIRTIDGKRALFECDIATRL